jgi:hypothetical protein
MAAVDDVDELIEQFHLAQEEVVKGNPEPVKKLFSHRDDVTLANPLVPPAHGWDEVAEATERAVSQFREGEVTGFENLRNYPTPELAYIAEEERFRIKVARREEFSPVALRTTSIL